MAEKPSYKELEKRIHQLEQKGSEYKQIEDSLRESEQKLAVHIQNTPIGVISWDLNFKIVEWNPAAESIFGYAKAEAMGKDVTEFVLPEDQKTLIDGTLQNLISGKGGTRSTNKNITKDGRTIICDWYNTTLKNSQGIVMGVASLVQDITERKLAEEELSVSRAMLKLVLDTIPQSVFWKDLEGRYLGCNRVFATAAGLSVPAQIVGKTDYDLPWPRKEADAYRTDDKEVIENNHSKLHITEQVQQADGTRLWVDTSKVPLRGADGQPFAVLGVYDDITEQKRTEEALRESEKKYQSLFNNAQVALFRTSLDGKLIEINARYAQIAGYPTIDDCMDNFNPGKAWADPDKRSELVRIIQETGCVNDYEAKIIDRDGNHIWILFSATVYPEQGFIEGSLVEITDRKQMEQSLRESEARFKLLHNASFGGIAIHDKGMILDCNQGLSGITGYAVAELIGMDGLLLIAEKSRNFVMDKILTGYEKAYEAIGLRKDGTEYPIRLEARNIPYKGKALRTVEFRDITETKKAEEEHKKLQEQFAHAQKLESIGRLAGGVAHDFNNMLSIILGNTEMLLDDLDSTSPAISCLHEIQKATDRSINLTRQLLAFARKQTIAPKVLDLNETIEGMLKLLRRLIGEDINLAWLPRINLWAIKIDPSQIDQILANLCINARDSIKDVGKLTIETGNVNFDNDYCREHDGFQPGDYAMIAVSDNGCGMDKQIMDKLFEPFFTTKDVGQGTGLGLATVYGIVKQNNGFINVYSEPGKGTTFRIYFPRYAGKDQALQALDLKEADSTGCETILLVEDEEAILTMTALMLERLGYIVFKASTPDDAIKIGASLAGTFDLLITDVVMPGMNGRDLAKKMATISPNLKCLFMSGYTANVIAHHGVLDYGMQFIQKPFSRQDLAAKVREVLDGTMENFCE